MVETAAAAAAKIHIDTKSSPYRLVNNNNSDDDSGKSVVRMPKLVQGLLEREEWNKFIKIFNKKLETLEETVALLKVVTVILVVLYILVTGGIVARYALLGSDNEDHLGLVLSIVLFTLDVLLFSFHLYFLSMVIKTKLEASSNELQQLCVEVSEKMGEGGKNNVHIRYVHWSTLKVIWYDKIEGHIEIIANNGVASGGVTTTSGDYQPPQEKQQVQVV